MSHTLCQERLSEMEMQPASVTEADVRDLVAEVRRLRSGLHDLYNATMVPHPHHTQDYLMIVSQDVEQILGLTGHHERWPYCPTCHGAGVVEREEE